MKLKCSGWWQQQGYGRQPMEELELTFENGQVSGSGTDIVGDFVFGGVIDNAGIRMVKQYIGQHKIEYQGVYDGEGVYFGEWNYAGYLGGKWLIRVGAGRPQFSGAEAAIAEL